MINAVFFQHSSGLYNGFSISGHADFEEEGLDIVCAGVSSAVMFASNLITETFSLPAEVVVDENLVTLRGKIIDNVFSCVIHALQEHLQQLQQDFPDCIQIQTSFEA